MDWWYIRCPNAGWYIQLCGFSNYGFHIVPEFGKEEQRGDVS